MSTVDIAEDDFLLTPQKRAQSSEIESSDEFAAHDGKKKKPGRKPITIEASSKRTAQNRAAQRAFRERKQQYLKDLEDQVKELAERQERTERENKELKKYVDKLKDENSSLKNGKFTYNRSPVDFDKAIAEIFDGPSSSSNINLKEPFDLQQAALKGTDLTQPGAMSTIHPTQATSSSNGDGASPQSVPTLYPNFDLSSATTGAISSSITQQPGSAFDSLLTGNIAMSNSSSSGITSGFNNSFLNGIQLLASNQNISTGSFLDTLFDSPNAAGSSMAAPISPPLTTPDRRQSTIPSAGLSNTENGMSRSPSVPRSSATPGDMFVPLNNIPASSSNGGGFFGMDTMKGQQSTDFTHLASLLQQQMQQQQTSTPETSQSLGTPSFNDLFSLSPSTAMTDSLISLISSAQHGIATNTLATANSGGSSAAALSGFTTGASTASSLPAFMQNLNATAPATTYQASEQTLPSYVKYSNDAQVLPSHLMAYRNPDPLSLAEDSDQLEKLLLDSIYSFNKDQESNVKVATLPQQNYSVSSVPGMVTHDSSSTLSVDNSNSSKISGSTAVHDNAPVAANAENGNGVLEPEHQLGQSQEKSLECTCRNCDDTPCAPCPKHGSPGDISEELRGIAPEMLGYVCTSTNTLADEELNDLCSLMYKHAKCSEVQRRVEKFRDKLKDESNLELLNTKKQLAKQYGLH
ncbi:DNA-binding transcription factor yap1 [Coemansia spiralis]|uniref:DNA-binding transcription factor yap1 n=2 Tax=Coemansia TaxID=4863 RepID=A0A9W8G3X0_9FUNG|nr:hypothetical protein BX070DRAFT_26508 [Coemansia spiralis]KAJ1989692.1 DNA-binding transcription factor yap1 [Coemansia umbellata]KAJ2620501.1 DNA-binding transcription factor yap1 [Coemansia sp. RSA 1358]KAJ2673385.1 DNA-binding transcription factor yap1 [Coemansia spiralis]